MLENSWVLLTAALARVDVKRVVLYHEAFHIALGEALFVKSSTNFCCTPIGDRSAGASL